MYLARSILAVLFFFSSVGAVKSVFASEDSSSMAMKTETSPAFQSELRPTAAALERPASVVARRWLQQRENLLARRKSRRVRRLQGGKSQIEDTEFVLATGNVLRLKCV